ncbi:GntR family transcriptional regulator [Yeosuana aromativorans]|uniref:GntR family transcriptional regulator n=1 Tax=Yeosuana aromativorans TaxID=288019 RepID=A0A8J3BMX3_9FLAO|nr:FCD domain-containing protein [Yeosuana aromativorans]GGK33983.1 GntR family transcriptional regulator [Yeosuana aromativorans]
MDVKKKFKKIKPLENLSLVDKVELRIIDFIKENDLAPGDAIPKETEFAESLGVSRTAVREAILRLRTLGLIESKKHRGMILTHPDVMDNMERVLDPKLLGNVVLKNLFELRLILEMGMADILFARKTQKDIDELEMIVQKEEKDALNQKSDRSFNLVNEISFHGKLYDISNNVTLQRFQNMLLPVFEFVHEQHEGFPNQFKNSNQKSVSHRDLLDNIKIGNPETFRNAMRQHLEPHFHNIININQK